MASAMPETDSGFAGVLAKVTVPERDELNWDEKAGWLT
jgi:hypothetical protein